MDYGLTFVDFYTVARDNALKQLFSNYPDITLEYMSIQFSFPRSSNNDLAVAVIDSIVDAVKSVNYDENHVYISFDSMERFTANTKKIWDLYSVVGKWKSLQIIMNGVVIHSASIKYLFSFLSDLSGEKTCYTSPRPVYLIRAEYQGKKKVRKLSNDDKPIPTDLNEFSPRMAMNKIIEIYQNLYLSAYSVKTTDLSDYEKILIVEDSFIIYFLLTKDSIYPRANNALTVAMQEMTFNDLFKFNWSGFRRSFVFGNVYIDYIKFKGLMNPERNWENKIAGYFNNLHKRLPDLRLMDRYYSHSGFAYNFVIFELIDINGQKAIGIGCTINPVYQFVLKVCKELEKANHYSLNNNGVSSLDYRISRNFIDAFLSWKGKKRKWILENQLSYTAISDTVKEESEIPEKLYEIHSRVMCGDLDYLERGSYVKPANRWKTEELVYNIIKTLYGNYQVIYQYRPFFLSTERGQLSYDVYICGMKIAIEYQGKQHFEPVEYFGGEEHFARQVERDKLKKELSQENGIKLIYVNYWDDITPQTIREKIEKVLRLDD